MDIDNKFYLACKTGNLKEAKKILSKNPNIDISADDEYAFRFACINGHLELAQWLLSVKPDIDISAENNYAFRYSCEYGHLKVALWLQSLKPYLYVIKNITDDKIEFYIRTNEEAKWENMKYGLWLQDINTNILSALPIDISKTILTFC